MYYIMCYIVAIKNFIPPLKEKSVKKYQIFYYFKKVKYKRRKKVSFQILSEIKAIVKIILEIFVLENI